MFIGGMISSVLLGSEFMIGFILCICAMGVLFLGSIFLGIYKRKNGFINSSNSINKNNVINMSNDNSINYKSDQFEIKSVASRSEEQIVCQKCGHINDSSATYCESCGQCLVKKCSCGATNDADAEYCKKCGKKL